MWGKGKAGFNGLIASVFALLLISSALPVAPLYGGDVGEATVGYHQEYLDAVADARVAKASEISRRLIAIGRAENSIKLCWDGVPGKSRVLVVTWTDKPYYDNYVGKDYSLPRDANVWVTVVPQLKRFTVEHASEVTTLRIEQLLGLPPNSGKTKFVEMWASPRDLFRPSPDPEITDHEAQLTFPTAFSRFLTFDNTKRIVEWDYSKGADVSYTYPQWFIHRKNTIYSGANPYPWTRLGYTYDWGSPVHEGLSELVVLGGSTVGIKGILSNAEYLYNASSN